MHSKNPFQISLFQNNKYAPWKTFSYDKSLGKIVTWCDDLHIQFNMKLDYELGFFIERPNFGQPVFEDILNQELLDNADAFC